MNARTLGMIAAAGLALAACDNMMGGQPPVEPAAQAHVDPITQALSGNTLTRGDISIHINPDGTLSGTSPAGDLIGTWEVQDGQWCDTIVEPEAAAGAHCMAVALGDDEVTFINPDGSPGNTWEIS